MVAIVGPSGSGKTTLMNFMSGRQNTSQAFKNFGHYFINNTEILDVSEFKNIIGYVVQEDLMDERLTPRQLITLYARLRKNEEDDPSILKDKVNDMINLLNI